MGSPWSFIPKPVVPGGLPHQNWPLLASRLVVPLWKLPFESKVNGSVPGAGTGTRPLRFPGPLSGPSMRVRTLKP